MVRRTHGQSSVLALILLLTLPSFAWGLSHSFNLGYEEPRENTDNTLLNNLASTAICYDYLSDELTETRLIIPASSPLGGEPITKIITHAFASSVAASSLLRLDVEVTAVNTFGNESSVTSAFFDSLVLTKDGPTPEAISGMSIMLPWFQRHLPR
ncbi:MAG: hypothetical protein ACPGYT_08910 [Nitrospirales bacterium]